MSGYYFKTRWDERNLKSKLIRDKGECHIWQKGKRLQLVCPYNAKFVQAAIGLAGNWRDKSGIWSFRVQSYTLVRACAVQFFGKDKVTIIGEIQVPIVRANRGQMGRG